MRVLVGIFCLLLLAACATPIPLESVSYDGQVSATSNKSVSVAIITGAIRGSSASALIPAGGIFVPISTGPVPELQFNVQDQRAFGDALQAELLRLKLFNKASGRTEPNPADVFVNVLFAQTYHNINHQEYTLDVVMELQGAEGPFLKQYRVVSSEKDSAWGKWNTNAYEGKAKAVKLLLAKLIPDIEQYVDSGKR